VNRELIRNNLAGTGPFIIGTSDGKQYSVPHSAFVLIGRHNVVVEQPNGFLDIIDPLHVVSIRPGKKRAQSKS
jgi:hypothetical protein